MHRRFHSLLAQASGYSEFVLAVNLDIRGFSDWSRRVESSQTILYLTKVYRKLIETYFPEGWFFKPTGDGLLLVRPFVEAELAGLVEETVNNCFAIVDVFEALCESDPMINYEVPKDVGIGLAQGAASRLAALDESGQDLTLDYSGRVLNLASRLMELARPRGVVIDSGFGAGLLPETITDRLDEKVGYIRGVSPDDSLRIFFDPAITHIDPSFERRPADVVWHNVQRTWTLREMEKYGMVHVFALSSKLFDPKVHKCWVIYRTANDRKHDNLITRFEVAGEYVEEAGRPCVEVDVPEVAKLVAKDGVKSTWDVTVRVDYPVE